METPAEPARMPTKPPFQPVKLRCTERHTHQLTLTWEVEEPDAAFFETVVVEQGWCCGWSQCTYATDCEPELVAGNRWEATIANLSGGTDYDIRVYGQNALGAGEPATDVFKTSEVAHQPEDLELTEKHVDRFSIEWRVPDPEGAPITSCQVEICHLIWCNPTFTWNCEPKRVRLGEDLWCCSFGGLTYGTNYTVAVRGINEAGKGMWTQETYRTSDLPSAPVDLRCDKTHARKVCLEWDLPDPEGADVISCMVQVWMFTEWGEPMFEDFCTPQRVEDTSPPLWRATLARMSCNNAYEIRVCGMNEAGWGPWAQKVFNTCATPPEPRDQRVAQKHATALELEWNIADPEGAPITACEVQIGGCLNYASALFEQKHHGWPVRFHAKEDKWLCTIVGLTASTKYNLRVRGWNEAGPGPWDLLQGKTADKPSEIKKLVVAHHCPTFGILECKSPDPEGAPVTSIDLQMFRYCPLGWEDFKFGKDEGSVRGKDDTWSIQVNRLIPDTSYDFRVRARNPGGTGPWAAISLTTSGLPHLPTDFTKLQRTETVLPLEWVVEDPEGAEITDCEIQYWSWLHWNDTIYKKDGKPHRVTDEEGVATGTWRARVAQFYENDWYHLRVRGLNSIGEGPWCTAKIRTFGPPEPPVDFEPIDVELTKLTVEWSVGDRPAGEDIEGCEVEILHGEKWEPAEYQTEEDRPKRSEGTKWTAGVSGLCPNTSQTLRVRGSNRKGTGEWSEPTLMHTQGEPKKPFNVTYYMEVPDKIVLEWEVEDPHGAEVSSCVVENLGHLLHESVTAVGGSLVGPTAEALALDHLIHPSLTAPHFWPSVYAEGGEPKRVEGIKWTATITGANQEVGGQNNVRIAGVNAPGRGPFLRCDFHLPRAPDEPKYIEVVEHTDSRATLRWYTEDVPHAKVGACEIEMHTIATVWSTPKYEQEPTKKDDTMWETIITNIPPATAQSIRIRACSGAGKSDWADYEMGATE